MQKLIYLLLPLLLVLTTPLAEADDCRDIDAILNLKRFKTLTEAQATEAKISANWSDNEALLAFCYEKECFIIRVCEAGAKVIDISPVVESSVYQVAWNPEYDRMENRPIITSENRIDVLTGERSSQTSLDDQFPEIYGTKIRTRIWIKGQRYTVYKDVLIRGDDIVEQ